MFEHAQLSVGASPGFRTLSIKDPTFPLVEILVPMTSFAAAEAAKHLMRGDEEEPETRQIRPIEIARA